MGLTNKIEKARFMFGRLANAAWNTTEAFVDNEGSYKLELDNKLVDPSGGRGEAFSYIKKDRVTQSSKRSRMKEIESTDRDLRKLHKPQLLGRLIEMGVRAEDLTHL